MMGLLLAWLVRVRRYARDLGIQVSGIGLDIPIQSYGGPHAMRTEAVFFSFDI